MNMKTPKSPFSLTFDPEKHQYRIGDKRIPGVSEILQKVGLSKNYEGVDPFYRDRGKAAHKAIELYLKNELDHSTIDPAIEMQFKAFMAFWKDHAVESIMALEKPMTDLHTTFAGTPDLVTNNAVYDWKCSKAHDKVADLQGEAYKLLVIDKFVERPFVVVELHDDGTFQEFDYGCGTGHWPSVMDLYRWRTKK